MNELKRWIKEDLPQDEWYHDGYLDFFYSAEKMLNAGMHEDMIKEILQDLFGAVSDEFGG